MVSVEGQAMFEQFNTKLIEVSTQFADASFKAHGLAMEGFEKVVSIQIATLEDRYNANAAFFGKASEVRGMEAAKTLLPETIALNRETAETVIARSQEVIGVVTKTNEAITALFRGQIEAANENFVKPAARKAAK